MRIYKALLICAALVLIQAPVFATQLAGDATQNSTCSNCGGTPGLSVGLFTATASGTADTGHTYFSSTGGQTVYMVIYSASGNLIAQSQGTAISGGAGWQSFTFYPAVSITAGTQYYIGIWADGLQNYGLDTTTGSWYYYNGGTWSTAPSSATFTQASSTQQLSSYLTGTASGGSCTHSGWSKSGSVSVPNGSSGSYWGKSGNWVTPDCSSVYYWSQAVGNWVVN